MPKHPKENIKSGILVISDNVELSQHLLDIINIDSRLAGTSCEIRYSCKNQSAEGMRKLGATAIDLKNDASINEIISTYSVVFSLHCKQIFPSALVDHVRCINVHPGLNPYNRGWFPQIFSIVNGLPAGVTIHLMDNEVDHGPVIYQQPIPIHESDTSLDVYRKIITSEKALLSKHFSDLVSGNYQSTTLENNGNYNSIQDFNTLCEINLQDSDTMEKHLNILRALTHGHLKNAFFTGQDGIKYYIRVEIEAEQSLTNNDKK
jgi:methionyl-tRNA formyltransferase